MPEIDAAEAFTGGKTKVLISCANEDATIYYTLDGSEPNTHSMRYTGPFEVQSSVVIKAFATLSDYADSAVSTKSITKIWVIGDSVGLPDHSFTTNGAAGWVDENGQAMRSGKISDNQVSILQSSFIGKGHLSFELKTSCEEDDPEYIEYDHAGGAALNGHKVWECYVAGEEPTDSNSLFHASVEIVDGMPIIHWSPDLNSNSLERVYTVWGKTNLTDKAWHSPTNECSHFFKVTVEMP